MSGRVLPRAIAGLAALLALGATTSAVSTTDLGVPTAAVRASDLPVGEVLLAPVVRPEGSGKYSGSFDPTRTPAIATPGPRGIPGIPYAAYRAAEARMAADEPRCGIRWSLLAGIGYVESTHVHNGRVDAGGTALEPVLGPVLDGTGPGDGIVRDTDGGVFDGDTVYDRALGPGQFLPGIWEVFGADGNGDGKADPQNVFDSALGTARYLCSDGMNLRDSSQVQTAVYRYNHSYEYVAKVVSWADTYATASR